MADSAEAPPDPLDLLAATLQEAYASDAKVAEDGGLHLRLADDLAVSVLATADRADLVFYAPLADLLGGRGVALMGAALAANLHQGMTRGGAMAVDLDTQTLLFNWRLVAPAPDPELLVGALENFCATALELRAHLQAEVGEFTQEEFEELQQRAAADDALDEPEALETPATAQSHSPSHIVRG
jgi:hypothetical protein